jgi:hypothetical protein
MPHQRPKPRTRPIEAPLQPKGKPARAKPATPPPIPPDADSLLSVDQFCASEGISRRTFDGLRARGEAPRFFLIGRQIRITRASRAAWREQRERMAQAGDEDVT